MVHAIVTSHASQPLPTVTAPPPPHSPTPLLFPHLTSHPPSCPVPADGYLTYQKQPDKQQLVAAQVLAGRTLQTALGHQEPGLDQGSSPRMSVHLLVHLGSTVWALHSITFVDCGVTGDD